MKKIIIVLFLLGFSFPCFAATVGSPADMTIPEESLCLKKQAVNNALDLYEYNMNIRGSVDAEIVTERKLNSAPADVSKAKLEGQSVMFKLSNNFYDVFEPYVKLGTSDLEVTWTQHDNSVTVESKPGFVWGLGAKAKVWEFKGYGVKLTLDAQYTESELDIDKAKMNGSTTTASAINETFKIREWQLTLLASKKFILPLGGGDLYVVPYTGMTFTNLDANVHFTQSTTGALYSIYNASDKDALGVVLGCDIMPSLLSWYLLSFELRLVNETAFTIGGTIRF